MNSSMIILIAAIAIPFLWLIATYNSLIGKRNAVENAFSSIDVMLKKRHDLIPNLVETVKKYMMHEKSVLTEIVQLRSQIVDNQGISHTDQVHLENQLSQKLNGLNISVENYPDLKASSTFLDLQRNLNEVESQLSASRRAYNASILSLNNAVEMFPSSIIAKMMQLKLGAFFEISESEAKNPNIKELFK